MQVQFDIHTKYFVTYGRSFFEAISMIIHNWKKLEYINIWLIR